jgi:hypothetical protein
VIGFVRILAVPTHKLEDRVPNIDPRDPTEASQASPAPQGVVNSKDALQVDVQYARTANTHCTAPLPSTEQDKPHLPPCLPAPRSCDCAIVPKNNQSI